LGLLRLFVRFVGESNKVLSYLTVVETVKPMKDLKQALLDRAASLIVKTAAPVLWKYVDEDGKDFYLTERRTGTIRSPYSGKSFTPKPEKSTLSDVGKELKQDSAKVKGSLWKYVDESGKEFYLPERITGTIKSPYDGKSFTPKAEKSTLSDVGKELKQDAKSGESTNKKASLDLASEILQQGESHPALIVIKRAYDEILEGVKTAAKHSIEKSGAEKTPMLVLTKVKPAIHALGETSLTVAKQLEQRLGQ